MKKGKILVAKVKEKKMANKKIWMGMLVMVLVFGMTVVGCNNESDNDDDSNHTHKWGAWIEYGGQEYRECTVCGYVEWRSNNNPGVGHTHSYGSWQSNATQHWKVCTASGCTNPPSESERGNHSGNPCVTCGYSNEPQIKTPPQASYINATGNIAWINLSWSFPEPVDNVIIEVWSPSSGSWRIDQTLSGSATEYDFRYKGGGVDYVVSGTNGPQGKSDENFCVFLRIRGRNGTELGPRKAMMWDTLWSRAYTTLSPVYEN